MSVEKTAAAAVAAAAAAVAAAAVARAAADDAVAEPYAVAVAFESEVGQASAAVGVADPTKRGSGMRLEEVPAAAAAAATAAAVVALLQRRRPPAAAPVAAEAIWNGLALELAE